MRLVGKPIRPCVAIGPTRLLTIHELVDLHHSKRHAESDQELREIFCSPEFRIHAISDLGGIAKVSEDKKTLLGVTFWSAVNELLENRGSGIVFAVASVTSRYLRSAIFSLDPKSREEFCCLSELGKSILAGLLRSRQTKYSTSQRYFVFAPSLNLPEAVSLEPRVIEFAMGTSVDAKLRIVVELLESRRARALNGSKNIRRNFDSYGWTVRRGPLNQWREATSLGMVEKRSAAEPHRAKRSKALAGIPRRATGTSRFLQGDTLIRDRGPCHTF